MHQLRLLGRRFVRTGELGDRAKCYTCKMSDDRAGWNERTTGIRSMLRARVVYAVFALLAAGCPQTDFPPERRPNLLLITLDTTRADHCSLYGYEHDTTPNLRALAEDATRFDLAYAPASSTGPTHATIFTSLAPLEHGLVKNGLALAEAQDTLAEHLARDGYEAAAFVSSFVLDEKFGFAQGFADYDDEFKRADASLGVENWVGFEVTGGFDRRADATTDQSIEWLRARSSEEPFFLFVHYFDPHSPYEPPASFSSRFATPGPSSESSESINSRYDGEIAFTDEQLGRLLAELKSLNLFDDTLIVVTGDHGEGLGHHGHITHGLYIYEEALRVPLLIRRPGGDEAGGRRVIGAPVILTDLAPTILDLLAVGRDGSAFDGDGWAPAIAGDAALEAEPALYFQTDRLLSTRRVRSMQNDVSSDWATGEKFGLRQGRWKYIEDWQHHARELFDLTTDPGELTNLASARPLLAATLARQLGEWREAHTLRAVTPVPMSEYDIERLRALGYVE
jgi:arylsulfatase A-like enzyme